MSERAEWVRAFARQADADLRAYELYARYPKALAAERHRLLFLQMACEKLCKSYLIQGKGGDPYKLQRGHGYTAKNLPIIIRQEIALSSADVGPLAGVLKKVRHISQEIELLNPAVKRGERRKDNCEYPWEYAEELISPLDWHFTPVELVAAPAGVTFLKLLRGAINRILD